MNPFSHTGLSISDSLKSVRKSVLIYETIILSYLQAVEQRKQSIKVQRNMLFHNKKLALEENGYV